MICRKQKRKSISHLTAVLLCVTLAFCCAAAPAAAARTSYHRTSETSYAESSQKAASKRAQSQTASSVRSVSQKSASTVAGGIVLPSVGSVSEKNMFSNPVNMTQHNRMINGVGIALWTVIAAAVVFVFLLAYRNRKHARKDTVGHKRYSAVRRDKKKRLLGDKYYNDSKYRDEWK